MRILRVSTVAVVSLCLVAMASTASAQSDRFSVQQFDPQPSQHTNLFHIATPEVLDAWRWEVGLVVNYADDPLVLREANGDRFADIVPNQLTTDINLALGIAGFLEIGVTVPLIVLQDESEAGVPATSAAEGGFGLGDVRIVPAVEIINMDTEEEPGGFSLGLLVDLHLPTGDATQYQGGVFTLEPRLLLGYAIKDVLDIIVNAGFQFRGEDENQVQNLRPTNAITAGLGLDVQIGDSLHIIPEVNAEIPLNAEQELSENTPLEGLLGLKYFVSPSFLVEAGGGTGFIEGYGTPDWRVFAGLAYAPAVDANPDRDGDRILNEDDQCPDDPEDYDGYQDEDGCPDRDNDGDGILDAADACPMIAEDMDGDEDEDGCPEEEGDADGDGILDSDDECPNDPEDVDGFEDLNGCPDPDNDQDTVLDVDDRCPMDPEDMDGWADDDGCPDPDNDGDAILDGDDGCPNEAENYNGVEDEDGCPDEDIDIVMTDCNIDLQGSKVEFSTDSARIRSRSTDMLNRVASVLNIRGDIHTIRVEGHTDDRGSDDYNLDLSQRRAESVRTFLIEAGVDPSRLQAVGYGESRPIDSNDNTEGRQRNRRVEFNFLIDGCDNQ